ncbi:ABC transporter ATP-binding protein [Thermus igniterrae]|jgi:branched-chain amino acid transport system ATP-binding protein|uniref:ABC transporter ATP-binding protein n=1 Tax=Thermus igniterrae TaxID=88189 RepID=UPI000363FB4F|nr:ABC transporter ATP-binding protein [Thermus igniterrae]
MLEIHQLGVSYGAHRALEGVNLFLAPGEVVAVLGANGAGKSSLLKALLGLVPARGQVFLDGEEVTPLILQGRTEALAARGLALVPERGGVFRNLSLRENLLLGSYRGGDPPWEEILALFPHLEKRMPQRVGSMSGGEQRMVALARALAQRPRYLLLDEPTLGLAPILARKILETLPAFTAKGVGVLLVEQNAGLALGVAQRAYLLEQGHLVREGTPEALLRDPSVRQAYLGG